MRIKDGSDFMIPRGESRFRVVFSVVMTLTVLTVASPLNLVIRWVYNQEGKLVFYYVIKKLY